MKENRMNRFDRKSFKQASRRKANDLLDKIKNLFGKEVTLDKICFDNEYCIDFDGTVDGKSAYISIAIEKWPGYTGVTIVVDNDVFPALVRGGASEAAKYLSENFTILSGEDKLFKEAKDHDEALRTSSRDIASRRKADDYYQLELDFDDRQRHIANRAIAGKHEGTSDIEEYSKVLQKYVSASGEGDTIASQVATAVNRILGRFLNDGDTIWSDSLCNEADWLYENAGSEVSHMIDSINGYTFAGSSTVERGDEGIYAEWLGKLLDYVCYSGLLENLADDPATGSIYDCFGPVTELASNELFFEDIEEELGGICSEYGYTLESAYISGAEAAFNITSDTFDVEVIVTYDSDSPCSVEISEADNYGIVSRFHSNAVPDQCAEAIVDRLADFY